VFAAVVKDSVKFEVPLRHGSQDYEQAIVDFDKQSILLEDSDLSRKLHICAVHLRVNLTDSFVFIALTVALHIYIHL